MTTQTKYSDAFHRFVVLYCLLSPEFRKSQGKCVRYVHGNDDCVPYNVTHSLVCRPRNSYSERDFLVLFVIVLHNDVQSRVSFHTGLAVIFDKGSPPFGVV